VEADEQIDGVYALDFFDEVRIVWASEPRLIDRLGAVLGRSKRDADQAEVDAVAIDGELHVWALPLIDLAPTGKRRPEVDYYPG
jgi:hypothetical protein